MIVTLRRTVTSAPATLVFAVLSLVAVPVAGGADDHRVSQLDKKFSPATLTLKAGDTVTFVNDDLTIHNIYSETPGHEFEIKRQNPRQVNTVSVKNPGTFVVGCKYHGQMKLTVIVTP